MAITNEFREAVDKKKLSLVHIMLKNSMLIDPTLTQFGEMEEYALKKIPELYVQHDGEQLNFDMSTWSDKYMNAQMVKVINNFSKERVDLLKKIVRHKYKDRADAIRKKKEHSSSNSKDGISKKQTGTGMTAVGAAAAVIGICTAKGLLIAGGAICAAAGVALILTNNRR